MGLNKINVNNNEIDVIVQDLGSLTDVAMSQKAVTDAILEITNIPIIKENISASDLSDTVDFEDDEGNKVMSVTPDAVKVKAITDLYGNSIIPTIKSETISDLSESVDFEDDEGNKVMSVTPDAVKVKDITDLNGNPIFPHIDNETISDLSESVDFEDDSGNKVMTITPNAVKVKAITDLNGNPIIQPSPYSGKWGVVMGDSHAQRRAEWVPFVYSRMGIGYDANVATAIVGAGNEPGAGYEDCVDPMYAQAVRAIEQYNLGNPIDFILFENVHYASGVADLKNVVPFKIKQLVNIGSFNQPVANENNWFNNNFNSIIGNITPKLGTLLKSIWTVTSYTLTFAGTPQAGNTFTLIINGNSFAEPVQNGDTLNSWVAKMGSYVFDENNWATTVNENKIILTFIGSGTPEELNITYNDGGSGITMTSSKSQVSDSRYRYFNSLDISEWNVVGNWINYTAWRQSALMGAIELLKENIPNAEIIVVLVPCYRLNSSMFHTELGYNMAEFLSSSFYADNRKRATSLKDVADFYRLKCIDIEFLWSVSLSNWFDFNPEDGVHPLPAGYLRMADTISRELSC